MAAKSIAKLSINLGADTSDFRKKMDAAAKKVDRFRQGVDVAGKALIGLGAAAGAAAVAGLVLVTKEAFKSLDSLAKVSDRLGIATEALAGLRFAAGQAGIQTSQLDMALQRMTRRVAEAGMGTGEAVKALQELGLSAQDLSRLSPDEQFYQIAEALNAIPNQADRVRLAFKLFDAEGVALLQLTQNGAAGIQAMVAEADRLGLAVNRVNAKQIENANDAYDRMGKALQGIGNTIAVTIAPFIEVLTNKLTNKLADVNKELKQTNLLLSSIGAILDVIGRAWSFLAGVFKLAASNLAIAYFVALKLGEAIARVTQLFNPLLDMTATIEAFKNEADAARMSIEDLGRSSIQSFADAFGKDNPAQDFLNDVADAAANARKQIESMGQSIETAIDTDAMEAAVDGMKELEQFARRLFEQTRTDEERFAEQVKRIEEAFREGLIDEDTYRRALEQAQDMIRKSIEEPIAAAEEARTARFAQGDISRMSFGGASALQAPPIERQQLKLMEDLLSVARETYRRQFAGGIA